MFVLYEEPTEFLDSVDHDLSLETRIHFNISAFAAKMGLGNPIAGTYFSVSGLNETGNQAGREAQVSS
jgi:hypothetical protein